MNDTYSVILLQKKQANDGTTVEEDCRKAGISIHTYYRSCSKHGELVPLEMKRLNQLATTNAVDAAY